VAVLAVIGLDINTTLLLGVAFLILIVCTILLVHWILGLKREDTNRRVVLVALLALGCIVLLLVLLGLAFFSSFVGASSGNNNLAGSIGGHSVNLTLGQETVPVYIDPSWWQVVLAIVTLIIGIPALFSALRNLQQVEESLKSLVSINKVNNYQLIVPPKKDGGDKKTDPKEARPEPKEAKIIEKNLATAIKAIKEDLRRLEKLEIMYIEEVQHEIGPSESKDRLKNAIMKKMRKLDIDLYHLNQAKNEAMDAIWSRDLKITNLQAKHWYEFWK
jgi:hypothetical protein